MDNQEYLTTVAVPAKPRPYELPFLPEVRIRNTDENRTRWSSFLSLLVPKRRLGEDPDSKSVGILYKNGAWLTDLVFTDSAPALDIPAEIRSVNGDLTAMNVKEISPALQHEVTVDGDLHVHKDLLRTPPPPLVVTGSLVLTGVSRVRLLDLPHSAIAPWLERCGGKLFHLSEHVLTFENVLTRKGMSLLVLQDRATDQSFAWRKDHWALLNKTPLDNETLYAVNKKLARICKLFGIGPELLTMNSQSVGSNLRKITYYMGLLHADGQDMFNDHTENLTGPVREALDILNDIEKNLFAFNADSDNIRIMLDTLDDDLLRKISRTSRSPQIRQAELNLRRDVEFLESLLDRRLTIEDLASSTVSLIFFLNKCLISTEGKTALFRAIGPVLERFGRLSRDLTVQGAVKFTHLLRSPDQVLEGLKELAESHGKHKELDRVRKDLAKLESRNPREFVRILANHISPQPSADASRDLEMVKSLASFEGDLDKLNISRRVYLELLLINLHPPLTQSLKQARRALDTSEEAPNKATQIISAKLIAVSKSKFVRFLLRRLEWDLSVLNTFNKMRGKPPVEEAPKKRVQFRPGQLAPETENEILAKLNRICLIFGLGKEFIEQHPSSWNRNIVKLQEMFAAIQSGFPQGGVSMMRGAFSRLSRILGAAQTMARRGDSEAVRMQLSELTDTLLRNLQSNMPSLQGKISTAPLHNDVKALSTLLGENLTLKDIFASTERFLQYLNAVLQSKPLRRKAAAIAKPLQNGLNEISSMEPAFSDLTLNDVLRNFSAFSSKVAKEGSAESREILAAMRDEVDDIRQASIQETLLAFRKSAADEDVHPEDHEFLNRLAQFKKGSLNHLGLEPVQTVRLLLLIMESDAVNDLKRLYKEGSLQDKKPLTIVSLVLQQTKRRASIAQAYNKLVSQD